MMTGHRGAAAQLLQEPNPLDAGQFDVHDAGIGQAMRQQRLRLIQIGASDDAVMLGIQSRPERFGQVGWSASTSSVFMAETPGRRWKLRRLGCEHDKSTPH